MPCESPDPKDDRTENDAVLDKKKQEKEDGYNQEDEDGY